MTKTKNNLIKHEKSLFVAIVGVVVSLILAGCTAPATHSTHAPQNLSILMGKGEIIVEETGELGGEFHRWEPGVMVVDKGMKVRLSVKNPRGNRHSFVLPDFGVDTGALEPRVGEATMEFTADKAGVFQYACGILYEPGTQNCDPDHKRMVGYLVVLDNEPEQVLNIRMGKGEVVGEHGHEGEAAEETVIGEFHRWEPEMIVVKKGDKVILNVKNPWGSKHSLVLPDFGVDTRALEPRGGEATVEFTADKAGVFQYLCGIPWGGEDSPSCDLDHKRMVGYLVVLDDEPEQVINILMGAGAVIMEETGELGGEFHRWEPGVIVVNKGDKVILNVTNPRGHRHSLVLPDFGVNTGVLEPRGGEATVEFTADKAGVFQYFCGIPWGGEDSPSCDLDHKRMVGYLVVLER